MRIFFIPLCLCAMLACHKTPADITTTLTVSDLGKTYQRNPAKTPDYLFYADSDQGGSTSIRRIDADNLLWKSKGYFQRNRELGQIFNVPPGSEHTLDAVVLRTGNSKTAILAGTAGAPLYFQLFEVVGQPAINDNGTGPGQEATHGFTTNHRADDYLDEVTYQSLLVAQGGVFPDLPATDQPGGQEGHLRYLRFDLQGAAEIQLEGGKRYAFIVGFSEAGKGYGFTLGNNNLAADTARAVLRTDANGKAWWGIRREGNGRIPPTLYAGSPPPFDSSDLSALRAISLFGAGHQLKLAPTTNGFPDVDTYRTLEFYLEVR